MPIWCTPGQLKPIPKNHKYRAHRFTLNTQTLVYNNNILNMKKKMVGHNKLYKCTHLKSRYIYVLSNIPAIQ